MEKRKPHYALTRIKELIRQGACRITRTALSDAAHDFGYIQSEQLLNVVLLLDAADFYKSMTTHHDKTLWQDVYRPMIGSVQGYVKVQIVDKSTVVISFKQR